MGMRTCCAKILAHGLSLLRIFRNYERASAAMTEFPAIAGIQSVACPTATAGLPVQTGCLAQGMSAQAEALGHQRLAQRLAHWLAQLSFALAGPLGRLWLAQRL